MVLKLKEAEGAPTFRRAVGRSETMGLSCGRLGCKHRRLLRLGEKRLLGVHTCVARGLRGDGGGMDALGPASPATWQILDVSQHLGKRGGCDEHLQ